MSLSVDQVRRVGGVLGIVFVIIAVVSLVLPGSPPKADEVAKIGTYFTDKRGSILAANYLVCLAFVFFLLFVAVLRSVFGAADPTGIRPGSAALAGGVAATSMVIAGTAVLNGAVFQVAAAGDANLNHALYDISNDLFFAAGFGFAAFFVGASVAVAATGALPRPLAPAGLVVALLNVVSGVGFFAKSGFFAIGGAFGFIVPLASLLWILAACIAMLLPVSAQRPAAGQT
jgi:hypothetical protein